MSSLSQNPLQPLLNQLTRVACLLERYLGMQNGQEPNTVVVTTAPKKATNARYERITIGTSPTLISPPTPGRMNISIVNGGAATVYIGADNRVTISAGNKPGYELLSQGTLDNDTYVGAIYGVVAAGTVVVTVWEELE